MNERRIDIYMRSSGETVSWFFLDNLRLCFKKRGSEIRSFEYERGVQVMHRIYEASKKSDMISVSGTMVEEFGKDDRVTELFNQGKIML